MKLNSNKLVFINGCTYQVCRTTHTVSSNNPTASDVNQIFIFCTFVGRYTHNHIHMYTVVPYVYLYVLTNSSTLFYRSFTHALITLRKNNNNTQNWFKGEIRLEFDIHAWYLVCINLFALCEIVDDFHFLRGYDALINARKCETDNNYVKW